MLTLLRWLPISRASKLRSTELVAQHALAPIRAMSFATWGGKTYLVAAYTCTPIVTDQPTKEPRGRSRPIRAPEQEGDEGWAIASAASLVATSGNSLPQCS